MKKLAVVVSGWHLKIRDAIMSNMTKKIIDKDGYVLIYNPSHQFCDKNGYVREHRLKIEKKIGRLLTKEEIVDHKNGVKNDNRLSNLRICTRKENARNSKIKSINNKSGYKGVSWDTNRKKWQASIKVDYKSIGLGRFNNLRDAVVAYNIASKKYFGKFARINPLNNI